MSDVNDPNDVEYQRLKLEKSRFRYDVLKWALVVIGAITSFYVIDLGKLKLEEFRSRAENQRALLQSYLTATESVQPDVWKRKLRVLQSFSSDESIRAWAKEELENLELFAERDALYRETLKVASQLVSEGAMKDPKRIAARARYEQLYWADLPFAKESDAVVRAMVAFRNALIEAEKNPNNAGSWHNLDIALITLSHTLRDSQSSKTK
jgi:hypothetical protein